MKKLWAVWVTACLTASAPLHAEQQPVGSNGAAIQPQGAARTATVPITLVIHGGGGVRTREEFAARPGLEQAYGDTLAIALKAEYDVLSAVGAVETELVGLGGSGGAIALDKLGNFATPYTEDGMYRGWVRADGVLEVRIYDR